MKQRDESPVHPGLSVSIQTAVNTGPVNYTVIIDGKSAVASARTPVLNQCYIVTSFTQAGLLDVQHTLKVTVSTGKLEFAGIMCVEFLYLPE
jgi:hypothetical protein